MRQHRKPDWAPRLTARKPSRRMPTPALEASKTSHDAVRVGNGALAQLGERLLCKQDVVGSIPSGSTIRHCT